MSVTSVVVDEKSPGHDTLPQPVEGQAGEETHVGRPPKLLYIGPGHPRMRLAK